MRSEDCKYDWVTWANQQQKPGGVTVQHSLAPPQSDPTHSSELSLIKVSAPTQSWPGRNNILAASKFVPESLSLSFTQTGYQV